MLFRNFGLHLLVILALTSFTWADPGDSNKLVPYLIFGLGPILVVALPVLVVVSILGAVYRAFKPKQSPEQQGPESPRPGPEQASSPWGKWGTRAGLLGMTVLMLNFCLLVNNVTVWVDQGFHLAAMLIVSGILMIAAGKFQDARSQ